MKDSASFDFYDMKGRLELLLSGLTPRGRFPTPQQTLRDAKASASVTYLHPASHPRVSVNGQVVGVFGELHPLVKKYDFEDSPSSSPSSTWMPCETRRQRTALRRSPSSRPVLEDIAIIVDESVTAERVEGLIKQTN
ncbi:MAG: hypothetical protein U0V48_18420 [Anaerolineales bacterium]